MLFNQVAKGRFSAIAASSNPLFCLVGTSRLELLTPWMSTKCSNQLSYAPFEEGALYMNPSAASNYLCDVSGEQA